MNGLKLAQAVRIIDTALAEARQRELAPLAVAVLDTGGNLVAFQREDRAGIARYPIAYGKAWGALGMGYGTAELADRAERSLAFFTAITAASGGRMIPSPGGVLIADADHGVIGAVGVSGDSGDNDEACAVAGIAAAGLTAVPGAVGG